MRLALAALTLGGLALRLVLLATYPLREDEAIYAVWARRWLDGDGLFMRTWPDKPPLFFWLLAGLFGLAGDGGPATATAAVGRWLNIAAGTLTIPVVAAAARRLWGTPQAGLAAALLVACSPLAISFGPTLYTDPLLVLWGSAAVAAALWPRPVWAGGLLAAAIMTKQQGVFYTPLVLALAAWPWNACSRRRLVRALAGLALVGLPFVAWDSLRWASAPSPWALAVTTYAPLALAPASTWGPRLAEWGGLLWYLAAAWPLWLLFAAAGLAALGESLASADRLSTPSRKLRASWKVCPQLAIGSGPVRARRDARLALVVGWGIAFVAVHVFTTIQVWDRYLLPLAPWLAWVVSGPLARGRARAPVTTSPQSDKASVNRSGGFKPPLRFWGSRVFDHMSRSWGVCGWKPHLLMLALVGLLAWPAWTAATGGYPVGGDHGDYAGLAQAFAWLEGRGPAPYVLYHQPLGWQARFYLVTDVDADQADLRWFPSTIYLADNAAKTAFPPKFVVIPDWAPLRDLDFQLAQRGLAAETRLRTGRFTVVEIVRLPHSLCTWCMSRPRWTPRVMDVAPTVPASTPAQRDLP